MSLMIAEFLPIARGPSRWSEMSGLGSVSCSMMLPVSAIVAR